MITQKNGRMIEASSEVRTFGRGDAIVELPNLVEIQTEAYQEFLNPTVQAAARENRGLEALLREAFPIYSYDKTMSLQYKLLMQSASVQSAWCSVSISGCMSSANSRHSRRSSSIPGFGHMAMNWNSKALLPSSCTVSG